MRAFRTLLGDTDMLAYLAMMAPRLVELRRVLKPTGSLFLHCDPTASHYLKILLDKVFGAQFFRNEIVWKRSHAHNSARGFGANHDSILFYSKGPSFKWNRVYQEYEADYTDKHYRHVDASGRRYKHENPTGAGVSRGVTGQPWRGIDPTAKGRHWARTPEELERLDAEGMIHWPAKAGAWPYVKVYLDTMHGTPAQDVWTDIAPINMVAKERLGFPTQKPTALLRRIIQAASNPGDVVLDAFCGCGSTIYAAQELGRRWMGIDITHFAIGLIKHRLIERYGPAIVDLYQVIGEPTTVEDAAVLARDDPFQFQAWALGLVGARQDASAKRGGDKGIDGRLFFHEYRGGPSKQIVISVKAGHLVPAYVRDLRGVIEREQAEIGVLVSFEEPTPGIRAEAASAGFYDTVQGRFPRLQVRTVEELLAGLRVEYPVTVEPPATLWPPETIPTVLRPVRRDARRREPVAPAAAANKPETEDAARLREEYQHRAAEEPAESVPSREVPQSLRTSKRGR